MHSLLLLISSPRLRESITFDSGSPQEGHFIVQHYTMWFCKDSNTRYSESQWFTVHNKTGRRNFSARFYIGATVYCTSLTRHSAQICCRAGARLLAHWDNASLSSRMREHPGCLRLLLLAVFAVLPLSERRNHTEL